ncbi:serine/threonine-protein kinase [Streptomyces sp. NBC_00091]|uniref:serine/threonine-protein kinase n=1 Tax=Streptomyces sp. NBC_00091 TaxID=2975648 RepID=UPI00224F63ED|nr:serine/threonine-protein kinase [Streptomyces sp. NBC_00091]MCX5378599.1 serine/threonine protein kinase [Streptomyces sp. NBC_00091]
MRQLRESDPVAAGPYRLLAELGRGGMGRVLLGAAPDGRLVAVKQVHDRFAADDGFRARFRREVAASQKVSGAYTAAVMEADADAETPWLASVFVPGPSLGAAVDAAGALPEETVRRLAAGLVRGLGEIHRAGLIHRDLKPDNVLLSEDGVRVIDFGIARAAEGSGDTELTRTGLVVGSPAFMSPEQAEGRELTPASDVFSLGSVLALAATGRSPFAGASTLQTLFNLVHAEPELSALPAGLRPVVERCLAKEPGARPAPEQLLDLLGPVVPGAWPAGVRRLIAAQRADIERVLGAGPERTAVAVPGPGSVSTAVLTQAVSAPPRGRSRKAVALAVAVAVGVAVLGAGAYLLSPGSPVSKASGEPDRYVRMPICAEVAGELPLPPAERKQDKDRYQERDNDANTSCSWYEPPYEVAGGGTYEPTVPHANVGWELRRSGSGLANGTERQREDFGTGRPETGVGAGDAAYWDTPGTQDTCVLAVRDGNLAVRVFLGGDRHPAESCETEAKAIARAALAAMPR